MASVWPNLCTQIAGVMSGPYISKGAQTPYIAVGQTRRGEKASGCGFS